MSLRKGLLNIKANFSLNSLNPCVFYHTQWTICKEGEHASLYYAIYRVLFTLFFIVTIIFSTICGAYIWPQFFTNWSFLLQTLYGILYCISFARKKGRYLIDVIMRRTPATSDAEQNRPPGFRVSAPTASAEPKKGILKQHVTRASEILTNIPSLHNQNSKSDLPKTSAPPTISQSKIPGPKNTTRNTKNSDHSKSPVPKNANPNKTSAPGPSPSPAPKTPNKTLKPDHSKIPLPKHDTSQHRNSIVKADNPQLTAHAKDDVKKTMDPGKKTSTISLNSPAQSKDSVESGNSIITPARSITFVTKVESDTSMVWKKTPSPDYLEITLWILMNIILVLPHIVVIGFWGFVYNPDEDDLKACERFKSHCIVHAATALLAVVDVFVTAVPFRITHFVFPTVTLILYILFSVLFDLAFENQYESGQDRLYPFLSWRYAPNTAITYCVLGVLFLPVAHLAFCWGLYKLRCILFNRCFNRLNKIHARPSRQRER